LAEGLENFGAFEDAMATTSTGLFHSRLSPLLNICRLLPQRILEDVLAASVPLASKEGFVRQVLGWREFVRHVHRETDGFRNVPGMKTPVASQPGDGGYKTWSGEDWRKSKAKQEPDGGANPSFLGAKGPLPAAYWGEKSGLFCLDHVVANVWEEGYSHHITRLMILSNLASLLDVSPRELTDWFWVSYIDAFDWVVEPNVLGMGTFAVGDLMTTKPYVSGTPYIHKMSDFCGSCAFDPKKNCPISHLYWAYLDRHRDRLSGNLRLSMPLRSLEKRSPEDRANDQRIYEIVSQTLGEGKELHPSSPPFEEGASGGSRTRDSE
jgi:deoxyribodipyrimidine photolyase-related protein